MKILFLSVGKKHDPSIAAAIEDFTARVGRYVPVEWRLIPSGQALAEEDERVASALGERDFVALLDERGRELDSPGLAGFIEKRLNESTQRLVFVIGGAYGAGDMVKNRADAVLSLSKLTLPHQLARLLLAEQVYRAFTILKGEKYHH